MAKALCSDITLLACANFAWIYLPFIRNFHQFTVMRIQRTHIYFLLIDWKELKVAQMELEVV